jgi:hypothetical protein
MSVKILAAHSVELCSEGHDVWEMMIIRRARAALTRMTQPTRASRWPLETLGKTDHF